MSKQTFKVKLEKPEGMDSAFFVVPFDVREAFGTKAQVKVSGTIDGHPYRSSIAPMGDGKHYMVVKKEIREAIGKAGGDTVEVVMEIDTKPRIVDVPEDFQAALDENDEARARFDAFSYTHRKEFVEWIESAKKPATRADRIRKAILRIVEGIKPS